MSSASTPLNGNKQSTAAAGSGGDSKPKRRAPRTQYHYVYGSILPDNATTTEIPSPTHKSLDSMGELSALISDQDSLIGESLIPTDDEGGATPSSRLGSDPDFPHLLVTSSNGQRPSRLEPLRYGSNGTMNTKNKWYNRWRQFQPVLFWVLIVVTALLITGLVAVVFFPDSPVAERAAQAATGHELPYLVPWPRVHRASYNDSVENIINMNLWDTSMVRNDGRSFLSFPMPTGAFWTNFVLKSTAGDDETGLSYPVAVYPYAYKWSDHELQLSYPRQHRRTTTTEIHDDFVADLTLSTVEPCHRRYIAGFDPLSVTLKYEMDNKGTFAAFLVQGSPYWTVEFNNVAPVLTALSSFAAVTCPKDADLEALGVIVDDGSDTGGTRHRKLRYGVCTQSYVTSSSGTRETRLQGVQFILQSQEGLIWYVFASEPLTWTYDKTSRRTLQATEPFTGVLRIALVPTDTLLSSSSESATSSSSSSSSSPSTPYSDSYLKSTGLARLIYHARVYPTSASVSWSFANNGGASTGLGSSSAASLAEHLASQAVTQLTQAVTGGSSTGDSSIDGDSTTTTYARNQSKTSTSSPPDRIATMTFDFNLQSFTQTSSETDQKKLLMLALPHHARNLAPSALLGSDKFDLSFECIKGTLKPVLGSTWSFSIALPTFGLDGDRGAVSDINAALRQPTVATTILMNLEKDIELNLPTNLENIYGYGKQAARLAQLLHVGMRLRQALSTRESAVNTTNETLAFTTSQSKALNTTIEQTQQRLKDSLHSFFTGNVSDLLVYDQDFGGIVSVDGLLDPQADFGNGRYNDHHFHYGYILYACAILSSVDSQFMKDYSKKVDAIMYDVAYQGNFASSHKQPTGPFFPGSRYKSWFDGHSFASGLFPAANGKSQESSSEAVNCYYGVYLWSLARNGALANPLADTSAGTDFARLLLATEIVGAKTYWQMLPPPSSSQTMTSENTTSTGALGSLQLPQPGVYSSQFANNLMVGNVGMLDVVARTWFGSEMLYVHMINFLPVTSMTGELFSTAYATHEYQSVLKSLEADPAWIGFVIANHAISAPNTAWTDALGVSSPELDVGLSKSQLLFWIATRKGFAPPKPEQSSNEGQSSGSDITNLSPSPVPLTSSSGDSCSTNPKCSALGLVGACCPTPDGHSLAVDEYIDGSAQSMKM